MKLDPIIGALQLALGRGIGMARFGNSPETFLASLAPLIAFPLVGIVIMAVAGTDLLPLAALMVLTLITQLGPAVLSHAVALRWGRDPQWLRYATAFNWCQLTIPLAALVFLVLLQVATAGAMPVAIAQKALAAVLALYVLWLNWTVARHGLALSRVRAVGLVALVNLGTILLIVIPSLLAWALE